MAGINENTKDAYISLDKSPVGYETFKQALQEKRIFLIKYPTNSLLISEFTNVERDGMTGKVDHTVDGSKDELDSLVGAVYSASKFLKVGDISTLDNYSSFMDVNEDNEKKFVGNSQVNKFFSEFSKKEDKTETQLQNERIDKELQTLKKLRSELDEEDKQKSDRELLDLYNNNYNFEDNDMLLF